MSRTARRRAPVRRGVGTRTRLGARPAPDWARVGAPAGAHGRGGRGSETSAAWVDPAGRAPGTPLAESVVARARVERPDDVEVLPAPGSEGPGEVTVVLAADRSRWTHGLAVLAWAALVATGTVLLVAALVGVGPGWLDGVGSVAVATAYSWGLAARTGGRPVVFGALACALGVAVLAVDQDIPRTGAAVGTCVVSAVLAVLVTRPAVRLRRAAAECALAVVVAGVGALASVGFAPVVSVARFEYVTLGLAVLGAFGLVHRLGAGLHGLGRRGVGAVVVGVALLAVTVLYAELLRRYGPPDVVDRLLDGVRWTRHHLGAFPRPIETVVGVPALVWGCHMRARRRQGWWLCAFGVAATTPVANCLVNPAVSLLECALSVVYGLVVGLVIGAVAIRVDLALTGSRDRGARRLEESTAIRPEPARTEALL